MPWTEETAIAEMFTHRNLGWSAAIDGRYLLAYQRFEQSRRCAPSSAHRALAHTDRAYIAFVSDESRTAEAEIMAAEIAANEADWSTAGEARMALLLLAELRAPKQVTTARAHLETYRSVAAPFPAMLPAGSPTDPRRGAMEHYATGVVERSEGRRSSAIKHFRESFTTWRGIGYKWRAALTAVHLGDLTLSDVYYDCAAIWMREGFPRAWFGRTLTRHIAATHPDMQALNAGQRAVLRGLVDGKRNKEIAEILDLSPNTVRNRIASVMRAFGCQTRTQLVAELRSRSVV
jgi:DNA-binding CsgD family transcriptional regulator